MTSQAARRLPPLSHAAPYRLRSAARAERLPRGVTLGLALAASGAMWVAIALAVRALLG